MFSTRSVRSVLVAAFTVTGLATVLAPAGGTASAGAPPGFRTVADDTGTFSVDVPAAWMTSTAPAYYDGIDGQYDSLLPSVSSTPTGERGLGPYLFVQAYPSASVFQRGEFYGDYGVGCPPGTGGTFAANGLTGDWYRTSGCEWAPEQVRTTLQATVDGRDAAVWVDYIATAGPEADAWPTIVNSVRLTGAPTIQPAQTPDVFPYDSFRDVPQLGDEPVRGTGCGADGSIGDVIPDGIWPGFVSVGEGAVSVDLICPFVPDVAAGIIAEGTANIIHGDPSYLVVNNNERERTVPTSANLALRDGAWSGGDCLEGSYDPARGRADRMAWVNIADGVATYVFWDCEALYNPGVTALAPAHPLSADDLAWGVWPYGEFWNVPQLGDEPVRGSGCGADGELGDRIPDGLWAGYIAYDAGGDVYWIDVLCIYAGDAAAAVRAQGTQNIVSDEPDYLVVNNSTGRRAAPNDLAALIYSGRAAADGRCVPATRTAAPAWQGDGEGTRLTPHQSQLNRGQAWIRLDDGAVTWVLFGCTPATTEPGS